MTTDTSLSGAEYLSYRRLKHKGWRIADIAERLGRTVKELNQDVKQHEINTREDQEHAENWFEDPDMGAR